MGSVGPPTLAKQSYNIPGAALVPAYPISPHYNKAVVYSGPACNKIPEIRTPSTLDTTIQGFPVVGINVASPNPMITVLALVTLMESVKL